MNHLPLYDFRWQRHPANPVLPPGPDGAADCSCCMNPFVVVRDGRYWLYYAGGDRDGHRRICLATAPVDDVTRWERHGPILDLGPAGGFDDTWCVLPMVVRFGDRWHLYWSGRSSVGSGLQSFPGIGLAFSDDGLRWQRYRDTPIVTGDQVPGREDNAGIAGGGTMLPVTLPDGSPGYRLYYTLATGRPSPDLRIDQEKHCAVCHSRDGIVWTDHRLILGPRPEVPHEDAAAAAPFVWRDGPLYRMLYSAIGTRWGAYSLAQAVSADGLHWQRGEGDANLVLAPQADAPDSWERQMVEYACVIPEGKGRRLFYCGNGYGRTGIGTAVSGG